jgi:hypothetical protein
MRSLTVRSLLVLAAVLMVVPSAAFAQEEHSPVMGAWLLAGIVDGEGVEQMRHPGLWIYTSTHYSTMFVIGDEARGNVADLDDITDADKLAAYESFIANSGRYEIEGDQLTTHAYVAKFPNYMHDFPDNEQVFTYAVDGDMMTLTTQGGTTISLRRVEGVAFPTDE